MARLEWETPDPMVGWGLEKHSPAIDYMAWMEATGRDWDSYKTFVITRHPEERAVAIYWETWRNRHNRDDWYWSRAGRRWWIEFDKADGPDEFIAAGLLDPDNPLNILKTQEWFSVGVSTYVPISGFADFLPEWLGVEGRPHIAHAGNYPQAELSERSREYVAMAYAPDYDFPF